MTKSKFSWRGLSERQNILRKKLDECKRMRLKFNSELDTEESVIKAELKELNKLWDKGYTGK